jgi:mersacidin/lichenicidin family type 2 lantibiotic
MKGKYNMDVIRAWKDEEYRNSLSAEQLAELPENPAGLIELTDADLGAIHGAAAPKFTWGDDSCLGVCTANCSWFCTGLWPFC